MAETSNNRITTRVYEVDKATWENGAEIDRVVRVSIDRSRSADMVMGGTANIDGGRLRNGYYRIVVERESAAGFTRSELATMYASHSKVVHGINGDSEAEANLYSVLLPANSYVLPRGWTFPKGGDPVMGALQLLGSRIDAPIVFSESSIRTAQNIVGEDKETALSMARYLLSVAGYQLRVDGHGTVSVEPLSVEPSAYIDMEGNDVVTGDVTETEDYFGIPNVVQLQDGQGRTVEAVNDDENSATSVQAVGFEVVSFQKITLGEGETLLGKAYAMLDADSVSARTLDYVRDFDGDVMEGDVIHVNLQKFGIFDAFRIETQSMSSEDGYLVHETASKAVDTFVR